MRFQAGAGHNPANFYDNFMLGLSYFLPMYIVTMAAGGFWEVLFAGVRNHDPFGCLLFDLGQLQR